MKKSLKSLGPKCCPPQTFHLHWKADRRARPLCFYKTHLRHLIISPRFRVRKAYFSSVFIVCDCSSILGLSSIKLPSHIPAPNSLEIGLSTGLSATQSLPPFGTSVNSTDRPLRPQLDFSACHVVASAKSTQFVSPPQASSSRLPVCDTTSGASEQVTTELRATPFGSGKRRLGMGRACMGYSNKKFKLPT
jgi:hypothetical protein